MLAERTINRFNGAVRECLEECYESASPLATLALYLDRLRRDRWQEAEIEQVETVVRRLLKGVLAPDGSSAGVRTD